MEGCSRRFAVTQNLIMAAVGAAVTFLGIVLSQIGKRGDQQIQTTKDQFQRLIDEAKYWKDNATEARDELEKFRDRQLLRCRGVTDAAYATISKLIEAANAPNRAEGQAMQGELEQHRSEEHGDKG